MTVALNESTITQARYKRLRRVMVTGANGSLGTEIVHGLVANGFRVEATDIDSLDVTRITGEYHGFDYVYHLAGAKHAPVGETDPADTFRVNTVGTENVLRAFPNAKIVLASTCKACNPETVYGASKLIAERMVLNAGGVVVRYFNVRETQGNVFRYWETLPWPQPIPYTDCWRYFITAKQAVRLTLAAADLPTGRYTIDPGRPSHMLAEAKSLYPTRPLRPIPPRRGDRNREPLHGQHEHFVPVPHLTIPNLVGIVSRHDHP